MLLAEPFRHIRACRFRRRHCRVRCRGELLMRARTAGCAPLYATPSRRVCREGARRLSSNASDLRSEDRLVRTVLTRSRHRDRRVDRAGRNTMRNTGNTVSQPATDPTQHGTLLPTAQHCLTTGSELHNPQFTITCGAPPIRDVGGGRRWISDHACRARAGAAASGIGGVHIVHTSRSPLAQDTAHV